VAAPAQARARPVPCPLRARRRPDCRRYVVTVTKDGWLTTAPADGEVRSPRRAGRASDKSAAAPDRAHCGHLSPSLEPQLRPGPPLSSAGAGGCFRGRRPWICSSGWGASCAARRSRSC
jgi:hypothetical protein